MKDLKTLIRPNVQTLCRQFVDTERDIDKHHIALNRCESPFNAPTNRKPYSTDLTRLKIAVAIDKKVAPDMVSLSVGQSTPLDLILRLFCSPQRDNIIIHEPSPLSFARTAALNDIECRRCRLNPHFDITAETLLDSTNQRTKAIILCNPNYPTGNLLNRKEILTLAERFDGLVVIDETFIEFSRSESFTKQIKQHPNIVVIGNFSAAMALGSLCLNYIICNPEITKYVEILARYENMPKPIVETAIEMLTKRRYDVDKWVKWILDERDKVITAIKMLRLCKQIYPTAANFFMMRTDNAAALRQYLSEHNVEVCDCSHYIACDNCLNITIGLKPQNDALLGALRRF